MVFKKSFLESIKNRVYVKTLAMEYKSANPFPHIVFNDAFDEPALYGALAHFPEPDGSWYSYQNKLEMKYAKDDLDEEHPDIQDMVSAFHSKRFVSFLEALTGINGLIADHALRGGGLHQIARGGKLDVHKDFNYHPELRLERRLNAILYLNQDWKPEWKGQLELWSGDKERLFERKAVIEPTIGTLAIFSTNGFSYHGHPDPLECPEGVTRKSMAFYYYTSPLHYLPADAHSTIYMKRPGEHNDPELDTLRSRRAKGRVEA
jgi:hypothetical protein